MLTPGTRIGRYEIVDRLGSGGMGEVYRAIDTRLGRHVALKILSPDMAADEKRLKRFEIEARAIAELSHPNILAIFDVGREQDIVYAALELIEGATLTAVLAEGPLSPRRTTDYARQLAGALGAAHARGICHRDVKPDNIMVTPTGHVMLLDFGLARRSPHDENEAGVTQSGIAVGTPRYMAPEQVRGEAADARTDIFALGVVIYEMLAGRPPFAKSSGAEVQAAILRDDPSPLPASVPTALQRIVRQCMEKSPSARFQSAGDLAHALEAIGAGLDSGRVSAQAPPLSPWAAWRFSWRIMATAVLAGVSIATGWVVRSSLAGTPPSPSFERLTFRKGTIFQARFAPGGQSVVYSAKWEGEPVEVFESSVGGRDIRARGLKPASLLSVSRTGELAISRDPSFPLTFLQQGRLATVSAGGAPRDLAEDVSTADWAPDGSLAIARRVVAAPRPGGAAPRQIEWPAGHVIHQTQNVISSLRVSPDGVRLAWFEHGETVDLLVARRDGSGVQTAAFTGRSTGGLAWTPDSREIWFTRSRSDALGDTEVLAVVPGAPARPLVSAPGGLRLLDIAPDGRLLASTPRYSVGLLVDDGNAIRDVNWTQTAFLIDLSPDGKRVVFWEDGAKGFDLFVRATDGSPATRLFQGSPSLNSTGGFSPDGSRVAMVADGVARIVPIGPGAPITIPTPTSSLAWMPAGDRVLLWARDRRDGHPARVTPDGSAAEQVLDTLTCIDAPVVSKRTGAIACRSNGGVDVLRENRNVHHVALTRDPGTLIAWSDDETAVYACVRGRMPQFIERLDLETGRMTTARPLRLLDPSGAWRAHPVSITPDGNTAAYSVMRQLDDLYIYTGIK